MIKKLFMTGFVLVIAVALFGEQASAFSQPRAQRPRQEGGRPGRVNRRLDRINRPPLSDPQPGRAAQRRQGVGPERKRRLQQQLMQAIGLTDDQRTRMADIRRSHEDALISAGRRLRQARQALDRTIMSEQYDEALIHRRAEELAEAQADMIRLRTRVRAQVRSVLTSDQVIKFNELERRLRRQMREQRENQMNGESQNITEPRTPPGLDEFDLVSLLLSRD